MHKKLMSANDFELAWRLYPGNWNYNGLNDRGKAAIRMILVDGNSVKKVYELQQLVSPNRYFSKIELSRLAKAVYGQLFVKVG